MTVFYYQYEGKTYLVCTGNGQPSNKSKIFNCNISVWVVPGTYEDEL